jgi:hypothetical protein
MRRLNTYVHAVELDDKGQQTGRQGSFGPDDDLSKPENAWVAKAITAPGVWDGDEDDGDKPAARGRRAPVKTDDK